MNPEEKHFLETLLKACENAHADMLKGKYPCNEQYIKKYFEKIEKIKLMLKTGIIEEIY